MRKIILLIVILAGFGFVTKLDAQGILNINPNEGLYEQNGTGYYRPMQYPEIREADVMWRKRIWRAIDFRQKMNQVFYYPTETHYNWNNFIQIILDGMKEGTLQAYKYDMNKDQLDIPISYEEFLASRSDTLRDEDTGDLVLNSDGTIAVENFDPQSVQILRIMEDWYFDRQRSQLMVRILAIGPVMIKKDGGGQQLFWISYNDNTRELFARSNFFNRDNPGAALNYDQVFMMRLFDSYIYKEENPYDRRINDYAKMEKALYESERIKQEIIDFEQNLWEY